MRDVREFLFDRKVQAALLIILVIILTTAVILDTRKGHTLRAEASSTDAASTSGEKFETMFLVEEITSEEFLELQTDENGKISSMITSNGKVLQLNFDELETETKENGVVSYKISDKEEVQIDANGQAKVITTETVTKLVAAGQDGKGKTESATKTNQKNTSSTKQPATASKQSDTDSKQPAKETPKPSVQETPQDSSSKDDTSKQPEVSDTTLPEADTSKQEESVTTPEEITAGQVTVPAQSDIVIPPTTKEDIMVEVIESETESESASEQDTTLPSETE